MILVKNAIGAADGGRLAVKRKNGLISSSEVCLDLGLSCCCALAKQEKMSVEKEKETWKLQIAVISQFLCAVFTLRALL